MGSVSERIAMVERELRKYNLKKGNATSLGAISSNISDRISILNGIHSELAAISEELYYYDMVDCLGSIKTESLRLGQCTSLAKELEGARNRFVRDGDDRYKHLCEKLYKRVVWAGVRLSKDVLKEQAPSLEFQDFYRFCPPEERLKLRRSYFEGRKRSMGKMIKECSENLERTYQLLILGEMLQYERVFGEAPDMYKGWETKQEDLSGFSLYIYEVFGLILNRRNESIALSILPKARESHSPVDRVFSMVLSIRMGSKLHPRSGE